MSAIAAAKLSLDAAQKHFCTLPSNFAAGLPPRWRAWSSATSRIQPTQLFADYIFILADPPRRALRLVRAHALFLGTAFISGDFIPQAQ